LCLVLIVVAVGAYFARDLLNGERPQTPWSTGIEADSAAEPLSPSPTASDRSDDLRKDLSDVKRLAERLGERIDALPQPPAPPDLAPLQERLEALSKQIEAIPELSTKLTELSDRVDALARELEATRTELAELKKPRPQPEPASEPMPEENDPLLENSATLFRQGQYAQALTILRKLQEKTPDDARVWYYSALAHGLANRQWSAGETIAWISRGIEREKAGTPDRATIDAAFADLTVPTGKDWLASYRQRAR
jgi:tetratricopeptide (TPR) repeat protein